MREFTEREETNRKKRKKKKGMRANKPATEGGHSSGERGESCTYTHADFCRDVETHEISPEMPDVPPPTTLTILSGFIDLPSGQEKPPFFVFANRLISTNEMHYPHVYTRGDIFSERLSPPCCTDRPIYCLAGSIYLSTHHLVLSTCLPTSLYLSIYQTRSIYLSVYRSRSAYPSIDLALPICLSTLSAYLSIDLALAI